MLCFEQQMPVSDARCAIIIVQILTAEYFSDHNVIVRSFFHAAVMDLTYIGLFLWLERYSTVGICTIIIVRLTTLMPVSNNFYITEN